MFGDIGQPQPMWRIAPAKAIVTWIELTYHRRRRQAGFGRLTPVEFEAIMTHFATNFLSRCVGSRLHAGPVRSGSSAHRLRRFSPSSLLRTQTQRWSRNERH